MATFIHKNVWRWGKSDTIVIDCGRGMVSISIENEDSSIAYLSGISVVEDRRNLGFGNLLLHLAKAHAHEMGAKELHLWADPNQWVFDWYKRHWFRENGTNEDGLVKLVFDLRKGGY